MRPIADSISYALADSPFLMACRPRSLYLRLLRDFQRVVDFDAQVSHRALKLRMAKQQLHSSQVLGTPVNQRRFGPPHGMGTVGSCIEAD